MPVDVQARDIDAHIPSAVDNPSQQSAGDRGHSTNASKWHIQFTIPELNSFSQHVKDAVSTGVVTARARKEITQVLRTYMTAYTVMPTPEHYNTICRKLIEKYPRLMDDKGTTKYVSVLKLCVCWLVL